MTHGTTFRKNTDIYHYILLSKWREHKVEESRNDFLLLFQSESSPNLENCVYTSLVFLKIKTMSGTVMNMKV